jgi:hypothetical protein
VIATRYEQYIRRRAELANFLNNEWDRKVFTAAITKEQAAQEAANYCAMLNNSLALTANHAIYV